MPVLTPGPTKSGCEPEVAVAHLLEGEGERAAPPRRPPPPGPSGGRRRPRRRAGGAGCRTRRRCGCGWSRCASGAAGVAPSKTPSTVLVLPTSMARSTGGRLAATSRVVNATARPAPAAGGSARGRSSATSPEGSAAARPRSAPGAPRRRRGPPPVPVSSPSSVRTSTSRPRVTERSRQAWQHRAQPLLGVPVVPAPPARSGRRPGRGPAAPARPRSRRTRGGLAPQLGREVLRAGR